tara:strand:- start:591 stop:1859 length:1269 start_codon:yes stop_codon:yes gene_type:complete
LKDIGIIKRVLAEAETSARLIAIRSLELMLSTDALKVLEESHANAISFEKFFIEKAIDNIKEFNESGVMPVEIQKAIEKQEQLRKDSVKFKGFEVESDYSQEPVEIGDLSSALSPYKSQESIQGFESVSDTDLDDKGLDSSSEPTELTSDVASLADQSNLKEILEEDIDKPDLESDKNLEDVSAANSTLPEETSDSAETNTDILEVVDSSSPPLEIEDKNPTVEMETSLVIDSQAELVNDYEVSDSYDDLLPSLESPVVNDLDSYDDLLPPLDSPNQDGGPIDSFGSLLPPVSSSDSGVIDNFDDLLQPPHSEGSINLEDDYKDLLPPDSSDGLSNFESESAGQNVDYDDLLPPLDTVGGSQSNDYDDLLPPLDVNPTEYDDLLPPMSSNVNTEDLLPPLKMDEEDTEDVANNYDDLLPPLK